MPNEISGVRKAAILLVSLAEFTRDVNKSLAAFQLEVRDHCFEAQKGGA